MALHLVWAQLVSEVVCVYLALLCWIRCAPEEVVSGHEVALVTGSCQALPVHGRGRGANGVRKNRRCFIMVLVALVAAVTSYGISDVHKIHREHARVQFNKNYEALNASGAQEWSVLFRAGRWSQGCSVNVSSRCQALPARCGRACFLLQLGAYGDALGGGARHLVISAAGPRQGWRCAVRDRVRELDARLVPLVDSMRCELIGKEVG